MNETPVPGENTPTNLSCVVVELASLVVTCIDFVDRYRDVNTKWVNCWSFIRALQVCDAIYRRRAVTPSYALKHESKYNCMWILEDARPSIVLLLRFDIVVWHLHRRYSLQQFKMHTEFDRTTYRLSLVLWYPLYSRRRMLEFLMDAQHGFEVESRWSRRVSSSGFHKTPTVLLIIVTGKVFSVREESLKKIKEKEKWSIAIWEIYNS